MSFEWTDEKRASLERLANYLEQGICPCPLPRADLLEFLRGQIEALERARPPSTFMATTMLDNAYLEWVNQALDL
ncbi:hypothetical protein [Pseudomonas gingeri]